MRRAESESAPRLRRAAGPARSARERLERGEHAEKPRCGHGLPARDAIRQQVHHLHDLVTPHRRHLRQALRHVRRVLGRLVIGRATRDLARVGSDGTGRAVRFAFRDGTREISGELSVVPGHAGWIRCPPIARGIRPGGRRDACRHTQRHAGGRDARARGARQRRALVPRVRPASAASSPPEAF